MDRHLLFVVGWLIALFRGCSSTSRGRAFGLLNCCYLAQSLHLVSNASCLGIRWLRHITQQHRRRHDILARSRETADGLFWLPVPDNLSMHLSCPSADASARWVRQVRLKDLLEQDEALTIFIKFCLELSQLRELRGSVFLQWWVDLSVIPRRPGVFPCCRGSSARNGILCLIGGFHRSVDMETLPSRVIAVRFRVGVQLGGVQTSASFLQ